MTSEQNQGQQTPPTLPPMPPSGGGGSRMGLFVGGCAVAAVLGIIAILAVGAFLFFFLSRPVAPEPEPQPQPTPEPTQLQPTPEPTQSEPTPEPQPEPQSGGGSLDELVQEQVGNFTLQQIEEIPEAISAGATDARTMVYASPDGVQISHDLTAWTSADVANQQIQAIGEGLTSEGFQQAEEFPVNNEEGQQIGTGVLYVGEVEGTTIEAILWSDDVLFCSVFAPEGYSVDFYNNLPY